MGKQVFLQKVNMKDKTRFLNKFAGHTQHFVCLHSLCHCFRHPFKDLPFIRSLIATQSFSVHTCVCLCVCVRVYALA